MNPIERYVTRLASVDGDGVIGDNVVPVDDVYADVVVEDSEIVVVECIDVVDSVAVVVLYIVVVESVEVAVVDVDIGVVDSVVVVVCMVVVEVDSRDVVD